MFYPTDFHEQLQHTLQKLSTCTVAHLNQDVFPTQSFRYASVCSVWDWQLLQDQALFPALEVKATPYQMSSTAVPGTSRSSAQPAQKIPFSKECSCLKWESNSAHNVMGWSSSSPWSEIFHANFFVVVALFLFFGKNWNVFLQWNL